MCACGAAENCLDASSAATSNAFQKGAGGKWSSLPNISQATLLYEIVPNETKSLSQPNTDGDSNINSIMVIIVVIMVIGTGIVFSYTLSISPQ